MIKVPKKTLAGVVGVIAAGVLAVAVPKFEGVKRVGYLDPIGIRRASGQRCRSRV
ncbi:hypothetical protein DM82_733 [Burkholderia oklahomensis]|uniref:Uncharacterized protein n=1 Tax=Burkholderia oklahomensis TaxID=342113 RepID=A0AAI8FMZ4_9BURK|nr:hypothetical protein DM82_733 [Burkholderia oklahomensis]AJX31842.1 hypothetical protein BG90_284 [Burkholderia oklahomensis C6786]SUW60281.1 Uncharacterised protein [Burkholderia oklahomensis]